MAALHIHDWGVGLHSALTAADSDVWINTEISILPIPELYALDLILKSKH